MGLGCSTLVADSSKIKGDIETKSKLWNQQTIKFCYKVDRSVCLARKRTKNPLQNLLPPSACACGTTPKNLLPPSAGEIHLTDVVHMDLLLFSVQCIILLLASFTARARPPPANFSREILPRNPPAKSSREILPRNSPRTHDSTGRLQLWELLCVYYSLISIDHEYEPWSLGWQPTQHNLL